MLSAIWNAKKLIKSRKSLYVRKSEGIREKRDVFTLTNQGGQTWSSERNPDWSRYCVHTAGLELEGANVEVLSPSRQTLEKYVEAERNLLIEKLGFSIAFSYKSLKNYYLVPWKRFSQIYMANWFEPFCLMREFEWSEIGSSRKKSNSWCDINDLIEELP